MRGTGVDCGAQTLAGFWWCNTHSNPRQRPKGNPRQRPKRHKDLLIQKTSPPLKRIQQVCTWKWMVGWLEYDPFFVWDGLFSGELFIVLHPPKPKIRLTKMKVSNTTFGYVGLILHFWRMSIMANKIIIWWWLDFCSNHQTVTNLIRVMV